MAKIVNIGGGSIGFAPKLIGDILTNPALVKSHLVLMDIKQENIDVTLKYAKKLAAQVGSPVTVEATTDLNAALDNADFVYDTVLRQGDARVTEEKISLKHGVWIFSGCTTGPAGVFRALREIPATLEVLRKMEKLCPNAYYFHYANPTNTVSLGLNIASSIKSVGLCHSVEGTVRTMAHLLGIPFEETAHWAAGINHQAWILRFEKDGKDLYPQFRELKKNKEKYERDKVRFDMMEFFGYFPTESSLHNSEYVPYFRKNLEMIKTFTPAKPNHALNASFGIDHVLEAQGKTEKRAELLELINSDNPIQLQTHAEYCIRAIAAMVSGQTFCFNGNVLNKGLITNLPPDICVEVPIMTDRTGLHPCYVGKLPDQCAALNASRSAGDLLAVKGALEGDKKAVEQAVALDPLTGALLTLDQIRALVAELFEVNRDYLPQFK